jgi:CBS-domain-containing membrane protein
MSEFFSKWRGDGAALPPRAPSKAALFAGLGGLITLAILSLLLEQQQWPLVLGSFGASCVLVYGFPDVPFSQPRNVVLGHVISSFSGLLFLHLCGPHWWSVALAVGAAITAMILTRTVHPPAGSNPVIIYLQQPGWGFLLAPTLLGAALLVLIALFYNNATRPGRYPKYW